MPKSLFFAAALALSSFAFSAPLTAADCVPTKPAENDWKPLFNGKDLDGWVSRGLDGVFTVENGEIVGTTLVGKENTFLCTTKDYGNFILELEYKCPQIMNSGVQIRSAYNPKNERVLLEGVPPLPGRKPGKVYASPNHVYGYQVEIEFNPGRTAGIYDEARRNGWVFPHVAPRGETPTQQDVAFRKQGTDKTLFKPGEWQTLRIEAQGDRLITILDGVRRTDVRDSASASGFIALQVHSSQSKKDLGTQVRFRNIRIKEGIFPVAVP